MRGTYLWAAQVFDENGNQVGHLNLQVLGALDVGHDLEEELVGLEHDVNDDL